MTDWGVEHVGVAPVIAAGLILAGATIVLLRYRRARRKP